MKKILVLGGFGFMGKNLNKVFKDTDYQIFNESRRTGCDLTNVTSLKDKIRDINPDIIINAAAHVGGVGYVSENSATVCSDNIEMYINLYKVIKEVNPNILLINPLANCSYPGETLDILEESRWWDGIVHESVESYGNSKKAGYILSECYRKQYGIRTINLLVPNAYGPFDSTDESMTHALNGITIRLLKAIKNQDTEFVIWGSGNPIREWIYMEDAARIIKQIIDENITELPNPINLGQNYGFSIKESVDMIQKVLSTDFKIKNDLTKKEGAPKKIMSDKLFREHFPNFVFTKPEDGIRNTVEFYKPLI
jgi:GDP-L-fucose synthase